MLRNRPWIALTIGALMAVGCGDDGVTTVASATDSDSSSATVTASGTVSATNTMSASNSATDTSVSGTMSGTMSSTAGETDSDSDSGETTVATSTTDTTVDPTDTTVDPSDTDVSATDTDPSDSDTDTTGMPGVCGDGVVDGGEQCDDGNNENGDGCEGNCTLPKPPACPNEETAEKCDGDTTFWYQAMEMGCSEDPETTPVIFDENLSSNNPNAWRIAKGFGTYMEMGELLYKPQGGESFLMISTGVIAQPNAQGIVTETSGSQGGNGDNQNDSSDSLPPPIVVDNGSNNGNGGTPFDMCDGVGDCSDSLEDAWNLGSGDPNNKLYMTWKSDVPDLVESYSFNFAYFSSEYPSWVDTTFNDLVIAWQTSEAYTGNVTFIGDQPLTVTSLAPYLGGDGYSGNEPQLAGTGFEGNAGTDWFSVNQNVVAGETLTMTIMIADMGDTALATLGILDNFHWNCEACIPVDDPVCMGEVPDPKCCGVVEPT